MEKRLTFQSSVIEKVSFLLHLIQSLLFSQTCQILLRQPALSVPPKKDKRTTNFWFGAVRSSAKLAARNN